MGLYYIYQGAFMDDTARLELTKSHVLYKYIKRIMDYFFAFIGIILTLPIMLIIAIAIKIDSKGPVIFKQDRTGKNGKIFKLYKFRSMAIDNDVHDFSNKDKHTKVGSIIRKLSLDELPQFFNILKGDMSFIGPRPWIQDYWDNMNEEQRHRCDVLPGITGLAQAKGRNNISIFEKINYDLEYVNNYSLLEDIKVIVWTIKAVISKDGADAGKGTIQNELEDLRKQ
jgi:lipopolysaccharide/colanic/teichoic acid biosynthesis glycosyltransferase